jgi:Kef-type K+ transport system membrane component KefB
MTPLELSLRFFLQVAIILAACRLVGLLARRLGQPQVVAEMVTGILLGPSLFGALAPSLQEHVFPAASRPILYATAQLGIALYMFLVGLTFETEILRAQARRAAAVSTAGIVVPFALGVLLAAWLVDQPGYFAPGIGRFTAMLFLGAAMSITAFPMLARIIQERGLSGTRIGTLVLAAGSIDDAVAWCLLAVVVGTATRDPSVAVMTIGGGALYAALMLTAGRRALAPIARGVTDDRVPDTTLAVVLMLVMVAAAVTELIGMHAVFGAFILGVALPRGAFVRSIERRLEPLTVALLLPLFFVYSGLNTRAGLLDSPALWWIAVLVLIAASIGKAAACATAAAASGESWRTALGIGTLMNARGLVELIMLNIGLERGIITPTLFTIMVLMAVATTLAASPLYGLVTRDPMPDLLRSTADRARP